VSNIYWVAGSQLVYALAQWFILWSLARSTGAGGVGLFALGLAVTAPALMLASLQLRALQATDTKNYFITGDYLTLRLVTTTAVFLGLTVFAYLVGGAKGAVIALVAAGKCFESVSDVLHGMLHRGERLDLVARSLLVKATAAAVAVSVSFSITSDLVTACAAIALAFLVTLVAYDIPLCRRWRVQSDDRSPWIAWRPAAIGKLLRIGLPLGYVQLLVSLSANAPRYFLERHRGETELGIFAAITYLLVAGQTFVAATGQAASPRLATLYSGGELSGFRSLLYRLLGAGAVAGIAGIVVAASFARPLLSVLYGQAFVAGASAFPIVMTAAAALYTAWLLGFGLTAVREIHSQALLLTASTLVTVAACWALIGSGGIVGASWAMFAGAASQALGAAVLLTIALRRRARETQR
jgi:O-antigen/teichoic acid export membrane protein